LVKHHFVIAEFSVRMLRSLDFDISFVFFVKSIKSGLVERRPRNFVFDVMATPHCNKIDGITSAPKGNHTDATSCEQHYRTHPRNNASD
jgi:hypothetical protein